MPDLVEQIETIPNDAEVWVQITHTKGRGNGFVMVTHYGFPVSPKALKRLARGQRSSWWDRLWEWFDARG
jgi:hypothetical protein